MAVNNSYGSQDATNLTVTCGVREPTVEFGEESTKWAERVIFCGCENLYQRSCFWFAP
jgi:hypothetical protein